PSVPWLKRRLQTRVYPYVLVQAGVYLNDHVPVQPRHVEMVYWYPGFPDQTVRLPYSASQYAADGERLERQVKTIVALGEGGFALAGDEKSCIYCAYRSYCDRGDRAGNIEDADGELDFDVDPDDFDFDLEQIAEIEF
ncbi:MAG: PD-(D/E)XK nuclease family protein, partial [Anaerolineae bacterium]|nr:PD-(D/E)XK nuclease family protein [Anaerolineae bacterium]